MGSAHSGIKPTLRVYKGPHKIWLPRNYLIQIASLDLSLGMSKQ